MKLRLGAAALAALLAVLIPRPVLAHCDTLDGPVVKDAREALEARDVTPALKWVAPDREGEIREAFARAVAVRGLGAEARSLADRFFFETLVRVHREGEGAPYTGLKPEGTEVEPGIAASDKALETGSVDALVALAAGEVERGLRGRYARVAQKRKGAGESVAAGREYVAAYVEFVHYAERVVRAAAGPAGHAAAHEAGPPPHAH
jgi:hypothetical protein